MSISRRSFLTCLGTAGVTAAIGKPAVAAPKNEEFVGTLVDTTRCIGCRRCEEACAIENGHPLPKMDDKSVFNKRRTTHTDAWTAVNQYKAGKGPIHVKRQCMHCNQAACVSACLVKAMEKDKTGPVTYTASRCMGCRYCMVSCPFDVPRYEYDSITPRVQKCNFCVNRQKEGKRPACVEACPVEALTFGSRRQIVKIAKGRIASRPDTYYPQIYGEKEAGGTSWLYLSSVPFEQIGFNNGISKKPYPEMTKGFLNVVPIVFVLWPAFLAGMSQLTRRKEQLNQNQENNNEV